MGLEQQIKSHLAGDFEAAWLARDTDSLCQMIGDLTSFLGYAIACTTMGVPDRAEGMRQEVVGQLEYEVDYWSQAMRAAIGADQANIIRPAAFAKSAVLPVFSLEEF